MKNKITSTKSTCCDAQSLVSSPVNITVWETGSGKMEIQIEGKGVLLVSSRSMPLAECRERLGALIAALQADDFETTVCRISKKTKTVRGTKK